MFNCMICKDISRDETPHVTHCCNAVVCQTCAARWATSNPSCPKCRRQNPTIGTVKLNSVDDFFKDVKEYLVEQQALRSQGS